MLGSRSYYWSLFTCNRHCFLCSVCLVTVSETAVGVGGGGERSKGKGFVTADLGGGGGGGEGGGAGDVPSLEISAATE